MGERKQRLVLAALLLEVNQLVPVELLVDLLWPYGPPSSARRTVQAHLSRLRTTLARAGGGPAGVSLQRRGDTYVLVCDPARVDAHQFRVLLERARGCDDDRTKARILREALALWRGPALADAASVELRNRLCHGLQEARLAALEERFDAELRLGHHPRLVDELTDIVARHPYRQHFAGQLMCALHGVGRSTDALDVYRQLRQRLSDELGLDPAAELTDLHVAILRADPGLDPRHPGDRQPTLPTPPAQLPADVPDFTGRASGLARLDELLPGPDAALPPAAVAVITGIAGIGKTALAVHWAHRSADRFTGQLYLNLRGYSAAPPMDPIEALTALLGGLGIAAERIPRSVEAAAALYRSLLGRRRTVVILDDASSVDQVRPLLPGNPGSVVLVTSRNRLVGLVARESARPVPLDALSAAESRVLLSRLLGAGRVRAEPAASAELAQLCDGLPLALRIAAANLANRHGGTIAAYVTEMLAGDRLDELEVDGDERHGVRAAFDVSYAALGGPTQRLLRLLSVAPGTELTVDAVAALAGMAGGTQHLLRQLTNANLVEERGGRFTVHNLLRYYSARRLDGAGPDERRQATQRLLAWYLDRADAAVHLLYPHTLGHLPARAGATREAGGSGGDPAAAVAWLESERANLVALVLAVAAAGPPAPDLVIRLAQTLYGFFYRRGHIHDWIRVNEAVRGVAKASRDRSAEARACVDLGLALSLQGQYERSLSYLQDGLAICREIVDRPTLRWCLLASGSVWLWRRRPDRAEPYLTEGLASAQTGGDRYGEAMCLSNLGLVHEQLEQYDRARAHHHNSLALFRELGCARGQGLSLHSLARLDELTGDHTNGERRYTECVDLLRAADDRTVLAHALSDLGRAHRRLGKPVLAMSRLDEALPMCQALGLRAGEATCHQELALLMYPTAPDEARRHWHTALAIFDEIGLAPLDEAVEILGDPDNSLVTLAT